MKTVEQTELHNYKKIEEAYKALKEVETPFLPTGMAKLTLKLKEELFILHRESKKEFKGSKKEELYLYRLKGFLTRDNLPAFLALDNNGKPNLMGGSVPADRYRTLITEKEFDTLHDEVKAHNWEKILHKE